MSKKPASLEMALAGNAPAAQPSESAAVIPNPANGTGAMAAKPKTYDQVTAYVPTACKKRLRMMCIEHDRDLNSFIREGIDLMLERYGQPSLKEFEAKS